MSTFGRFYRITTFGESHSNCKNNNFINIK